jgi:hypothetical protein
MGIIVVIAMRMCTEDRPQNNVQQNNVQQNNAQQKSRAVSKAKNTIIINDVKMESSKGIDITSSRFADNIHCSGGASVSISAPSIGSLKTGNIRAMDGSSCSVRIGGSRK